MKSEIIFLFTLFEKWKVNWFFISLFSRSESEIEKPRDRDREVKSEKNSRELSRNENIAGLCIEYLGSSSFFGSFKSILPFEMTLRPSDHEKQCQLDNANSAIIFLWNIVRMVRFSQI